MLFRECSARKPIPDTTSLLSDLPTLKAQFKYEMGNRRPGTMSEALRQHEYQAGFPEANTAIAHLRDVLGDQTYESLARKGEAMTTAAMATYAHDQIDQARTELNVVSK
jgi:hypothetical protein